MGNNPNPLQIDSSNLDQKSIKNDDKNSDAMRKKRDSR